MVIRINGVVINGRQPQPQTEIVVARPGNRALRRIATTLWGYSGIMFAKAKAFAADTPDTGLWEGLLPMFQLFQEVAMVLGALAIMAGLAILVFRKRWGMATIKTAVIVVGGVFLVPAGVMLLAIIGTMFNDRLVDVMKHMHK